MPDLSTLLADVTTRTPPPPPVERIHATVRRRAARRRAATTATALAGVLTVAVVVTSAGGSDRGVEPVKPTPTPTTTAPWPPTGIDGIALFVNEHPELFLGDGVSTFSDGVVTNVVVTFAGGVDPDEWKDDIDAVAAGQPWTAKQCARTKERYDAIAREVRTFDWPSGQKPYARTIRFDSQFCAVEVSLPQGPRSDADRAAAKARWGKDVRILTWLSPPFPGPTESAGPEPTASPSGSSRV